MLLKLEGHTLKVTCMLLLSTDILITGSADKSLRISFLHNNGWWQIPEACVFETFTCVFLERLRVSLELLRV